MKKRYAILRTSVDPGAEFTKSRKPENYWVAGRRVDHWNPEGRFLVLARRMAKYINR
jgi:hypothetical protein